jgi:hypothetical protein
MSWAGSERPQVWDLSQSDSREVQSSWFSSVIWIKVKSVEVVDFYGRVLFSGIMHPGMRDQEIEISHLLSGKYFVIIHFENQRIVKQIIKLSLLSGEKYEILN